jgi:hypothetical protein
MKMKLTNIISRLFLGLIILALFSIPILPTNTVYASATLVIQPSVKDTYMNEFNPDANYGIYVTDMWIDSYTGHTNRPLLEFNISGVPAGVLIISATLQLYYYAYVSYDPSGKTVWAYKQNHTDWSESQATWNIYKTGSNWSTAGGDYVTSDPAGGSTTFPGSYGWMSWDVLDIVQDAHDLSINAEFLMKFETEGSSSEYLSKFYTREYSDTSKRPKLTIEYATIASVGTSAPTNVMGTKARLRGSVASTGGDNPYIIFYWGDNDGGEVPGDWDHAAEPTSPEQPQGVGDFYRDITGLPPGTTCYCKTKATNSAGIAWGGTVNFNTLEVETAILRPDGAGYYTNIAYQYPDSTYHWDKVDDVSADDNDTYIFANTAQKDAFTLTPSSVPSGMTIDSVNVHFRCRGDASGYAFVIPYLRLGGNEAAGLSGYVPPATWTNYEEEVLRPGGGSWSAEDFDELQVAILLDTWTSDYGYCTQIYVEIYYYGVADPVVTTQDATVTSNTTATGHGNITGLIITPADKRGFDWDIDSGEPYANSAIDTGSYTTGAYTTAITGLPAGSTIYYRAKAHNSAGWAYGEELTFVTFDHPTVITGEASSISSITATLNGEITSLNGDYSCSERGFVYDTVTHSDPGENPPASSGYSDNYTETGIYTLDSFSNIISGLAEGDYYFVRAYALNSYGYSYGNEITFRTYTEVCWIEWQYGDTFTDLSGNGNDATPTFLTTSSDADVSALLSSFLPIDTARAPKHTITDVPAFITANITTSGNFTSGNVPAGGPPGFDVVDEAASSGGTPNIWLWGILGGFTIAMSGLGISFMEKKYGAGGGTLLLRIGVAISIIGLMVAFKKFDFWMLLFYIIITASLAMMSRHIEFGGSASEHNLIGFLAMSWIGLTVINRMIEGQFLTSNETVWANYYAFTQEFKLFNIFSVPVLNLDFFTQGIPTLIRWDYSFFGGNAQLIQYLLYSITAVVSFIIFLAILGLIYNFFNRLR